MDKCLSCKKCCYGDFIDLLIRMIEQYFAAYEYNLKCWNKIFFAIIANSELIKTTASFVQQSNLANITEVQMYLKKHKIKRLCPYNTVTYLNNAIKQLQNWNQTSFQLGH